MPRRFEPITVIANPWHALDDEGRPSAHIQMLGSNGVVGGALNAEATKAAGVHVFDFTTEPVVLRPIHAREEAFYLRQIADGALLAADGPTAARANVPFVEPAKAIERAQLAAADAFEAESGWRPDWAPQVQPAADAAEPEATKRRSAK